MTPLDRIAAKAARRSLALAMWRGRIDAGHTRFMNEIEGLPTYGEPGWFPSQNDWAYFCAKRDWKYAAGQRFSNRWQDDYNAAAEADLGRLSEISAWLKSDRTMGPMAFRRLRRANAAAFMAAQAIARLAR